MSVPLLSDWAGEATRGFDVAVAARGMADIAMRSVFLVRDDTIVGAWKLETPQPDIDAIIASAG